MILDYVMELKLLRDLIVMTLAQITRTAQLSLHLDPHTEVLPTRMHELLLCDSFREFAASSILDDNCLTIVQGVFDCAPTKGGWCCIPACKSWHCNRVPALSAKTSKEFYEDAETISVSCYNVS